MIELLTINHLEKILDLFDGASRDIRIISPFLSVAMAQRLCDSIRERGLRCAFITRFYIEDMVAKANSIDALEMLLNAGVDLYAVKRLHTKLYLFDHDQAIVGSANFTTEGFKSNIELSLAIGDQPDLLSELSGYFDDMEKKLKAADNGRVTHEMIEKARAIYMNVYRSKQRTNIVSRNYTMFGAALDRKSEFRDGNAIWAELDACQGETDLVSDLFRELEQQEQIVYPFNIWLKFDGEADHRLEATDPFPMTDFDLPSGKVYLSNYPFRVSSIKEGDEVYCAGLTTSKNGRNLPVIIGRGRLTGFTGKNHVTDVMIAQYPWMQRFPWYVTISECDAWTHRWSKESPWTRCGMLWVLIHTWRPSAGTKVSPLSAASTTRKRIYASQGMQSSTSTSALIRCLSSLVPFTTSPRLNRKRQDREPVRLPILSFLFAYFSKSMVFGVVSIWFGFQVRNTCASRLTASSAPWMMQTIDEVM